MKLLIKGGLTVSEGVEEVKDIAVVDGVIVDPKSVDSYDKVVDASGKIVVPGGIDVHTHFDIDVGIAKSVDDFYSGTVAAACGGTTTIVDHMGFGPKGCDLFHQLDVYHEKAKDSAVIDYGFHGVIQEIDEKRLEEIEGMVAKGVTSFKYYMTYGYKLDDQAAYKLMKKIKEVDGVLTVHAENEDMIQSVKEELIATGKVSPRYHGLSRPEESEAEAVARVINIASLAGDPNLYIVHLSSDRGLPYIKAARDEGRDNILVETCTQYLALDESLYEREDVTKFVLSPPLRPKKEQKNLWKGLEDGLIQVIGTDHCSFDYNGDKKKGEKELFSCPNGMPGVEERMPVIFGKGVQKGNLSLKKFVETTSTNPAKIFGMYPKKGTLSLGSDGDIVIFDKDKDVEVKKENLSGNADYTPYEGMKLKGYPVMTISRGDIIAENGKFVGEKGRGQYLSRGKRSN